MGVSASLLMEPINLHQVHYHGYDMACYKTYKVFDLVSRPSSIIRTVGWYNDRHLHLQAKTNVEEDKCSFNFSGMQLFVLTPSPHTVDIQATATPPNCFFFVPTLVGRAEIVTSCPHAAQRCAKLCLNGHTEYI